MHADGNIRYANYQSQQQVIDFLTANGFGPETYAGWFPTTQEEDSSKQEDDALIKELLADMAAEEGAGAWIGAFDNPYDASPTPYAQLQLPQHAMASQEDVFA